MPIETSRSRYSEDVFLASEARTTSGDSGVRSGYGGASTLRAQLDVTAVSGVAPTLAVVLEDTLDGTNWNTLATFSQKTAASREVVNVTTPFAERFAAALHAQWDQSLFHLLGDHLAQSPQLMLR